MINKFSTLQQRKVDLVSDSDDDAVADEKNDTNEFANGIEEHADLDEMEFPAAVQQTPDKHAGREHDILRKSRFVLYNTAAKGSQ
jgi:hypothetical protein